MKVRILKPLFGEATLLYKRSEVIIPGWYGMLGFLTNDCTQCKVCKKTSLDADHSQEKDNLTEDFVIQHDEETCKNELLKNWSGCKVHLAGGNWYYADNITY